MAYLGNSPANRFVASKAATRLSGNGSATSFTLEHAVGSDEDILVSVDGVIQEPSIAYAVSNGTTLTFTEAPSNGTNNIFVYYLFRTVGTVSHPSNNALTATNGNFTGTLTVVDDVSIEGSTPTLTLADTDVSNNKVELNYDEFLTVDLDPNNARGNTGLIIKGDGSEHMRIDSNGDVGIGASTVNKTLHISKSTTSSDGTVYPGVQIENTSAGSGNSYANLVLHGGNTTTQFSILVDGRSSNSDVYIRTDTDTPLLFYTNGNEKMRIAAGGGVGIGTTPVSGYRLSILTNGSVEYQAIFRTSNTSGTQYHLGIDRNGTQAGHLTSNANNQVALNNGSDYRLKENISDMTDGIERVKQLQPKKFNFLSNPDKEIVDGFLAHEVKDLVPYSVLGEKDAVDKDGEPVMQTIDVSALIPVLTGAIKELIAKVEKLESEVKTLKGE